MLLDELDNKIILELLRHPWISQRRIAELINVAPQIVNYRIKRLVERGVIKSFRILVDPRIYGLNLGIIVSREELNYPNTIMKVECLEGRRIIQLAVTTRQCLENIVKAGLEEGVIQEYYYFGEDKRLIRRINRAYISIVEYIKKNNEISVSRIAENLKIPTASAARKLKKLLKLGYIRRIPILDLSKTNILLLHTIVEKPYYRSTMLEKAILWEFGDDNKRNIILYAANIDQARLIVDALKASGRLLHVSLKTKYEILDYNPSAVRENCRSG